MPKRSCPKNMRTATVCSRSCDDFSRSSKDSSTSSNDYERSSCGRVARARQVGVEDPDDDEPETACSRMDMAFWKAC
jgi:hypothetical protein